ncbi:MAG: SDR family NAD(P)-dependent oxidoreductase, partial [Clostridia bacterium]|nr:SDR family NAD(P)-dependent oxidoreductase [Clostridia bacterium]
MKLPFNIDLKDKVAVVTGGGGVLCSEFAKALAANGAKVAVCDLRPENAQACVDAINADGGVAIAVEANVLDKDSLMAARERINAELGTCDILLNGAGGNQGVASHIIDNLCLDVTIAAIDAKARTFGRSADLFAYALMTNHAHFITVTLFKHVRLPPSYFL